MIDQRIMVSCDAGLCPNDRSYCSYRSSFCRWDPAIHHHTSRMCILHAEIFTCGCSTGIQASCTKGPLSDRSHRSYCDPPFITIERMVFLDKCWACIRNPQHRLMVGASDLPHADSIDMTKYKAVVTVRTGFGTNSSSKREFSRPAKPKRRNRADGPMPAARTPEIGFKDFIFRPIK
jgi:hypothetical protein